jgi:hypothetical protein
MCWQVLPDESIEVTAMTDDFTRIRGINTRIAARLHEAGILHFKKLAAMTPEEILNRIGPSSGFTADFIAKKDWIGQAATLAAKAHMPIEDQASPHPINEAELHAANYMVELFLNQSNQVQRTRIQHIQSDFEEAWDRWDARRLIQFFKQRPELRLEAAISSAPMANSSKETSQPKTDEISVRVENTDSQIKRVDSRRQFSAADEAVKLLMPKPLGVVEVTTELKGKPKSDRAATDTISKIPKASKRVLKKMEIIPSHANLPMTSFSRTQAFCVCLHLDLSETDFGDTENCNYLVTVLVKNISQKNLQVYLKSQGQLQSSKRQTLNLKSSTLQPGIYRITAALTLSSNDESHSSRPELTDSLNGGLFEVY